MRFLWFNLPSIKVWSKKRIVVKSLSFTTNLLLQVFLLPDFTVMLNVKWWCWYDSWAEVGDVPTDTWPPLKEISSRNHSFKGRMNLVFTARSSPMTRCIWICKWPKRKIKAHENDEKKKNRSKWGSYTFSTTVQRSNQTRSSSFLISQKSKQNKHNFIPL